MRHRPRLTVIARTAAAAFITIVSLTLAARARAYQAETVKDGGIIAGTVKFDGAPPARKRLEISKDREVCGATPLYDESLIVNAGGGIANAVVSIADITKGVPLAPLKNIKFDQKGCEYRPHVLAFPFAIKDVPPGKYTLEVWQEKLGTQTRKVTVEPGKPATVDFTMAPTKE